MAQHTIEFPEATYQLLLKQAMRLQLAPEQVLAQLVTGDLALAPLDEEIAAAIETNEALAAVERLSALFADVSIPDFEQHLNDPALALINADIE